MMNHVNPSLAEKPTEKPVLHWRTLLGGILLVAGGILFLDQYLRTTWLTLLILPGAGLFLYQYGARMRYTGLVIAGGILLGIGAALAAAFNPIVLKQTWWAQLGNGLIFFAIGWLAITAGTALYSSRTAWWALIPGGVVGGLGVCILFTPFHWMDIALCVGLGVGLPLLIWGIADSLYGLVIAACLLITLGPGIYFGWSQARASEGLAQTGITLVWFSLGWALITLLSRMIFRRNAWWPLIPGGILAVVGFALFIGGDPGNAVGFVSNTGSVALMILGLYLLLMRKGIHH